MRTTFKLCVIQMILLIMCCLLFKLFVCFFLFWLNKIRLVSRIDKERKNERKKNHIRRDSLSDALKRLVHYAFIFVSIYCHSKLVYMELNDSRHFCIVYQFCITSKMKIITCTVRQWTAWCSWCAGCYWSFGWKIIHRFNRIVIYKNTTTTHFFFFFRLKMFTAKWHFDMLSVIRENSLCHIFFSSVFFLFVCKLCS